MTTHPSLPTFATFGPMLRYLRKRVHLTQRELALAVGYSESMISRLEQNERPPDVSTLLALFVPALGIEREPDAIARLTELAARRDRSEGETLHPTGATGNDPLTRSVEHFTPTGHRLPYRLTSFVGRVDEIAALADLLARARLVTLTGPGGCGKTSLAVEVARSFAEVAASAAGNNGMVVPAPRFAEGIYLVELLPLDNPASLAQTMLSALGAEGGAEQPVLDLLVAFLNEKRVLLVLDNCEHLVEPVARMVETLLGACRHLTILATSRERLNLPSEAVYLVPALPFPDPAALPAFTDLREVPALQLFADRSQAVQPEFALTPENAPVVAHICSLLDGIPLAVELAAAAMVTFTAQEILARLDARFLLSNPGYRTADPRHRTLNETVAWSYNLLDPAERRLLVRLAVFVGGWTSEALEAVCGDVPACQLHLRGLVLKSLVRVELAGGADGRTRYHLLRAVRDYAGMRLADDAEAAAIGRRHFTYFAHLAAQLGAEVFGPDHQQVMARLDVEYPNIRSAFHFAADHPDLADTRLRLASELSYYWCLRSYSHRAEGTAWLKAALASEQPVSMAARAMARAATIDLHGTDPFHFTTYLYRPGESDQARAAGEQLVAAALAEGDSRAAGRLLLALSVTTDNPGDLPAARDDARRAAELLAAVGDLRGVVFAKRVIITGHLLEGNAQAAQILQQEQQIVFQQYQTSWGLCQAYLGQAAIAFQMHDDAARRRHLEAVVVLAEAEDFTNYMHMACYRLEKMDGPAAIRIAEGVLARQRRRGPSPMLGLALHQLGRMCVNTQQFERAQVVLDEALALWRQLDHTQGPGTGLQWSLIDRGQVARHQEESEFALRCFTDSIALFRASSFSVGGGFPLLYRGMERLTRNEMELALDDFREAIRLVSAAGRGWEKLIVMPMAGIGEVFRRRGDAAVAGKLMAASDLHDRLSSEPSREGLFSEFADFKRIMAPLPTYRQDPAFAAGWREGELLALDAAVELALTF